MTNPDLGLGFRLRVYKTWASGRGAVIHWQHDIVVENTLVHHAIDHVGSEEDGAWPCALCSYLEAP